MQAELELRTPTGVVAPAVENGAVVARRWALWIAAAILTSILLHLAIQGHEYYRLPLTERYRSPLHPELKPGGATGRMLGMTGSTMMITLLAYSLRKRVRWMRGWGKLNTWLQFHIFLGVAGPLLITFHTAFKLRGIVAISYWSMVLVALSGALGRYLYAQIPRALSGAELQSAELQEQLGDMDNRLREWLDAANLDEFNRITAFQPPRSESHLAAVASMIRDDLRWLFTKRRLTAFAQRAPGLTWAQRAALPELAHRHRLQHRRITFLKASHELFQYWHVFHLPLAKTMYLTMVIHVAVAVMTGYFWSH